MGIATCLILAARSLERILDDIASAAMFGFLPVLCIVFTVLAVIYGRKFKKNGGRPTKMIVFIVLAAFFGVCSICEVLLLILISLAISHM